MKPQSHNEIRSILLFIGLILSASFLRADTAEDQKLNAFFQEEWEWTLKQNPIYATLQGDLRYNDQIGDNSLAGILKQQEHSRETLKKLQTFDRSKLSSPNQLNYDLFLDQTQAEVTGQQFPSYLMPVTQLGGLQQDAPQLAHFFPFDNTKEYEDYLSRLEKFPAAIDNAILLLKRGLQEKITPPKITLRDVGDQIKAQIVQNPEDSSFYDPFKKFPDTVASADQEQLRNAARTVLSQKVIPAYQRMYDYWIKDYSPNTRESIGISALPNGAKWYAYLTHYHTTTDLTPEQIHQLGLSEVKRIRAEMEKDIQDSGFKGSFDDWMKFLRTDPQFFYTKPEDLVNGYRDICKKIDPELPHLFGKLPRNSYGVREIPAFSAPSQTTAYYNEGNLRAGRPGWYFVNTYKLNTRPKWEMEVLSSHEAVPGHHLQISLAQELENVPKFRTVSSYTAFVEGWGLYSESLGNEMGLYKDPYSKFGQLTYEMWRAVRLVVDTGIHTMGWDRQKAIDYFKANAPKQESEIIVEIDRYIVNPGQALAYKIGELKIKELRKYASDQLGDRFSIRDFHDHVLGNGAVPMPILEKQIKDWVAEEKKK